MNGKLNLVGMVENQAFPSSQINETSRIAYSLSKRKQIFFYLPVRQRQAALAENIVLDEKVYIYPTELDVDLITETKEYDIEVWNAGKIDKTLVSIVPDNEYGLVFDYPALPFLVRRESGYKFTLTVLFTGPAIQDSSYTFTFSDGTVYVLRISGRRLEWLVFPANYTKCSISYALQTVISTSDLFVEQRRALFAIPVRTQEIEFWYRGEDFQKFFNDIQRLKNSPILAPVFCEPLTVEESSLQGLSTITVNEDIEHYYNVVNTSYLFLCSHADVDLIELKDIDSINYATREITFKTPVDSAFTGADVIAYPAILSLCPTFVGKPITSGIAQGSLVFKEYEPF